MKSSIVIVNFKTDSYVVDCIDSLRRHCGHHDVEIIVVDNGAKSERFAERLAGMDVRYEDAGGNIGFGRACNLGASIATGSPLVFVNPDIVFTGDALALLQDGFAVAGDGAIIGLNLADDDGQPTYAAGRFPSLSVELMELVYAHRWMRRHYSELAVAQIYDDVPERLEVDYVCGALFGVTRQAFARLGGFNPDIFLYFEETELMFRHREAGGHVYLMCKITALHKGSVSTGADSDFKRFHMEYGRRVFYSTRYKGILRSLTRAVRGARLLMLFASKRRPIFIRLLATAIFGRQLPNL